MSSRFHPLSSAAAIVLLSALLGNLAHAQTARSGGAQNAQLMQQLQQLASERTSMQAENARIKKELEDMRKERDSLKNGAKTVDLRMKSGAAALKQSAAQRESAEQELRQTKDKLEQVIAKFREMVQTLREVEADRASAKQTVVSRDQELKACVDHNVALYKINEEVLARVEKQSMWTRVAASEPFTRLKRNQLENFADEYGARAKDQKLPTSGTQPANQPPGPAAGPQTSAPRDPKPDEAKPPSGR
jgi:chromosome segregation ATPase